MRKVSIRKHFFTGFNITKSHRWLDNFYVSPCKKIVFWSLPFHIRAQFWEQIANDYTLKDNFCITTIHSKVWLSNCGTFENATKNFFDFMIIWANSNNNKKLVKVWIYMTNSCTVEVETRIYIWWFLLSTINFFECIQNCVYCRKAVKKKMTIL